MTTKLARTITKKILEGYSIRYLAERYGYAIAEIEQAIREQTRDKYEA